MGTLELGCMHASGSDEFVCFARLVNGIYIGLLV